jgi:hypothetical protein
VTACVRTLHWSLGHCSQRLRPPCSLTHLTLRLSLFCHSSSQAQSDLTQYRVQHESLQQQLAQDSSAAAEVYRAELKAAEDQVMQEISAKAAHCMHTADAGEGGCWVSCVRSISKL